MSTIPRRRDIDNAAARPIYFIRLHPAVTCLPLIAALALIIPGCVTVNPHESFAVIDRTIGDRTRQQIHWRSGSEEDDAVDQAIREMLAQPLTADAAAQIALLNNRRLQAIYEDLGVAQADLVQAGLLSNPTFSPSLLFPTAGGDLRPNLGLTQTFLDIFFIPLRKRVAESRLAAAQQRIADRVIAHAANTRAAFYRVQADMQAVSLLRDITASTRESLDTVRQFREAGSVTYLDVRNKEALLERVQMELTRADSQLDISREQVTVLMGLSGDDADHARWTAEPGLPQLPQDEIPMKELEERSLENSLTLAAIRADVDAAGGELGMTEASALLPAATAGASAQRRSGEWFVGPSLSIPIPIFDQGQAVKAAAEHRLRQQHHSYEAAIAEVRSASRTAARRVRIAREVANHYRDVLLPLREEIYEDSLLQFNAMNISILDLIAVRQQQMDTEREYIEALFDYWLARTQLDQILAGSTPGMTGAGQ